MRARLRRRLRLPFHTKGVACLFHPFTVCSNQSITSCAFLGDCPESARRTMMRCTDSASTLARSRQQACKAASLRDQRTTAPGGRTDARPGYPRPARCVRQEAVDVAGDPTTFPTVRTVPAALRAAGSLRAASSRSRPAPRQAGFRARDARPHWSRRRRLWRESGQWPDGRGSAVWPSPHARTRAAARRDDLPAATRLPVAGWPERGPLHLALPLHNACRFSLLTRQLDQSFFSGVSTS
jgi:hypothetical protein